MNAKFYNLLMSVVLSSFMVACSGGKAKSSDGGQSEDTKAKQLLQGIWVNDDAGSVAFMAKGDSVFYPDSTSQPVYFRIVKDTLVLCGNETDKYQIVKQAVHLFEFKNQNGEVVKLVKSDDDNNRYLFEHKRVMALNQNQLIKRDTIVDVSGERCHCYMQVNPTTYKVVKSVYNNEGVEVDNVYYDNIVHLSVFDGARKVYSKDFYKENFKGYVPEAYLSKSILSDIILYKVEGSTMVFQAQICIPDSPTSYQVNMSMTTDGKVTMKLND